MPSMNQFNRIAVVYGSGATHDSGYETASNGADNSLPTDRDFFGSRTVINEIPKLSDSLKYFICQYFSVGSVNELVSLGFGLEDVWSVIDLMRAHSRLDTFGGLELTQESRLKDCEHQLLKLVHAVYGSPTLGRTDNYWALHKVLKDSNVSVHYITFNYDTCLEQSLRRNGEPFRYISDVDTPDCWLGHTNVPVVFKLHGSLNWKHKIPEPMNERPSTIEIEPTDLEWNKNGPNFLSVAPRFGGGGCGEYPAIIPPTWFKHEINDPQRGENRLTRLIIHQWKAVRISLQKAQAVIVVGYSFPRTDILSEQLFRLAIHQRGEQNPMRLLYCSGDDRETASKSIRFMKKSPDSFVKSFSGLPGSQELNIFLSGGSATSASQTTGFRTSSLKNE